MSKRLGVESNGVPGIVGSTRSAAAIVCLKMNKGVYRPPRERKYIRDEQPNNFDGTETSGVGETLKNGINRV